MATKLRIFQEHLNGDLLIKFQFEWASQDMELINKFGDPEINAGGVIITDTFIYPDHFVKLNAGFPYTRRINTIAASSSSLATSANAYVDVMEHRISDALTALRALESGGYDLTKEIVYQP